MLLTWSICCYAKLRTGTCSSSHPPNSHPIRFHLKYPIHRRFQRLGLDVPLSRRSSLHPHPLRRRPSTVTVPAARGALLRIGLHHAARGALLRIGLHHAGGSGPCHLWHVVAGGYPGPPHCGEAMPSRRAGSSPRHLSSPARHTRDALNSAMVLSPLFASTTEDCRVGTAAVDPVAR
jgi:hypothetical protein